MIEFDFGAGVRAFTAGRGDELPFEVTQSQQVHGVRTARIDRPGLAKMDLYGYDALMTDVPGIALGARTADCIPVLLYDERHRAVASVHAGWKGTVAKIVHEAIGSMYREYGTEGKDLKALIGPGICRDCFQVGGDVVEMFRSAGFPMETVYSWNGPGDECDIRTGHHIDLSAANRYLLLLDGVIEERIYDCGICTFEDVRVYSARREGSDCGRNINVIMLEA